MELSLLSDYLLSSRLIFADALLAQLRDLLPDALVYNSLFSFSYSLAQSSSEASARLVLTFCGHPRYGYTWARLLEPTGGAYVFNALE
jgi:hypothetical protein